MMRWVKRRVRKDSASTGVFFGPVAHTHIPQHPQLNAISKLFELEHPIINHRFLEERVCEVKDVILRLRWRADERHVDQRSDESSPSCELPSLES